MQLKPTDLQIPKFCHVQLIKDNCIFSSRTLVCGKEDTKSSEPTSLHQSSMHNKKLEIRCLDRICVLDLFLICSENTQMGHSNGNSMYEGAIGKGVVLVKIQYIYQSSCISYESLHLNLSSIAQNSLECCKQILLQVFHILNTNTDSQYPRINL
jgi:hypothetical protein